MRYTGADTRRARELHTHNLWQSHANGDTDGHSYGNCYRNCYSYGNCYRYSDGDCYHYSYGNSNCYSNGDRDRTATVYTDTKASSDAATSPVGSGTSYP